MRDIARAAGVSLITVSRALNPAAAHRVQARTRAKIERLAAARGYRVNQFARALRSGRGHTLALVLPASRHFAASEYYARIIFSIISAAHAAQYDVKVHVMHFGESPRRHLMRPDESGADGVIYVGFGADLAPALRLADGAVPAVLMNSIAMRGRHSVDADNECGGRMAAECLLAHGHRRLSVLAGPAGSQNAHDRVRGFASALAAGGVRLAPGRTMHSAFGISEGRHAAELLLQRSARISAFFCANDELAIGALQAVQARGLRCPADLSIIGFDNITATALTTPPLTTIEQPVGDMSTRCVETVLQLIAHASPPVRQLFPVRLVMRGSVAAYPRGAPQRSSVHR